VVHLTSGGELAETPVKVGGAVVSIDHCGRTGITAVSNGDDVFLSQSLGHPAKLAHGKASRIDGLAFSPNGRNLAFASAEGLSAWKVDGAAGALREISFPARVQSIRWSGDGTWLACALESGGFGLVSMVDGGSAIVAGFPAPVRTACWSAAANALVTSGAFRITAWSMSAPPLGGDNSGALETGRAGLFAVETVAAHLDKKLVAAGYADGRIAVAQIGGRDELVVRPSGGAVTALAWSGDGRHLAAGAADGSAAIVTFPPQMFK
jgi:WD40 repeat protein